MQQINDTKSGKTKDIDCMELVKKATFQLAFISFKLNQAMDMVDDKNSILYKKLQEVKDQL